MGLWLLRRLTDADDDGYNGFVVRAPNEAAARRLADSYGSRSARGVWIHGEVAGCRQISRDGPDEVLLAEGDTATNVR